MEDEPMKLEYIAPSVALICLMPAQKLADATIPYDDLKDPDFVPPGSFGQGDTEVDIPI